MTSRAYFLLGFLTLCLCLLLMAVADKPGYTDAYYYYNAGAKLATGDGLTDAYLWMYMNAPDHVPTESHRYWMPLASMVAALPMALFGTDFQVAQMAFIPFVIGLALCGMWLGWRIGQSRRHAWVAGLSVPLGGFYLAFWLTNDTFEVFGLVGCVCLIALGLGRETGLTRWYALAGAMAALAHLARADGLLLVLVGLLVIGWPHHPTPKPEGISPSPSYGEGFRVRLNHSTMLLLTYLAVMLPWFLRNLSVFGAPLPAGGVGTIFLKGYNDIFSYPAEWPLDEFLDWGAGNILQSRWDGLVTAFGTWLAVEGMIILAPLSLWALWQRRREGFFAPLIWYALGLHVVMSVVFTYPGARGGLFHSSAALLPFWMALGLVGLDDLVVRLAKWRKWKVKQAQTFFGTVVVFLPLALGVSTLAGQLQSRAAEPDYKMYAAALPDNARIMANDPAAWHYHTGLIGVTLPDEALETAYTIAQRYCITHLILDKNVTPAFNPLIRGEATPPAFLIEIRHFTGENTTDWSDDVRIYAFDVQCTP